MREVKMNGRRNALACNIGRGSVGRALVAVGGGGARRRRRRRRGSRRVEPREVLKLKLLLLRDEMRKIGNNLLVARVKVELGA